jgi:hypothetical protein
MAKPKKKRASKPKKIKLKKCIECPVETAPIEAAQMKAHYRECHEDMEFYEFLYLDKRVFISFSLFRFIFIIIEIF